MSKSLTRAALQSVIPYFKVNQQAKSSIILELIFYTSLRPREFIRRCSGQSLTFFKSPEKPRTTSGNPGNICGFRGARTLINSGCLPELEGRFPWFPWFLRLFPWSFIIKNIANILGRTPPWLGPTRENFAFLGVERAKITTSQRINKTFSKTYPISLTFPWFCPNFPNFPWFFPDQSHYISLIFPWFPWSGRHPVNCWSQSPLCHLRWPTRSTRKRSNSGQSSMNLLPKRI